MSVVPVTDETFENEVLSADKPVLVDFWAEWCQPCREIAPSVEALANDMGGALKVAKLDVDDNPQTPARYGIRGIPTLILFNGGEAVSMKVGVLPKSKLFDWVKGALASEGV